MAYNALSRACTRLLFLLILLLPFCRVKITAAESKALSETAAMLLLRGATVTLNNVNTGISTVRKTNETGHLPLRSCGTWLLQSFD